MLFIFIFSPPLLLSAPCSAVTPPVPLKVQAGGNASLTSHGPPLWGDHLITWTRITQLLHHEILVNFENGQPEHEAPERYRGRLEVDLNGSLHITDAKLGDTGVYTGQIINGDGKVRRVQYNVTVFNPVLTTHHEGPSSESSASLKHSTLGVFVLFLFVCLEYLF